jgi:hypothetical protein
LSEEILEEDERWRGLFRRMVCICALVSLDAMSITRKDRNTITNKQVFANELRFLPRIMKLIYNINLRWGERMKVGTVARARKPSDELIAKIRNLSFAAADSLFSIFFLIAKVSILAPVVSAVVCK